MSCLGNDCFSASPERSKRTLIGVERALPFGMWSSAPLPYPNNRTQLKDVLWGTETSSLLNENVSFYLDLKSGKEKQFNLNFVLLHDILSFSARKQNYDYTISNQNYSKTSRIVYIIQALTLVTCIVLLFKSIKKISLCLFLCILSFPYYYYEEFKQL